MRRRFITAIVIAMFAVGAAADFFVLSAFAEETLWKTKIVEEDHKKTTGYLFGNDVRVWIADYTGDQAV